jgi:hypothetical protein
MKDPYDIEEPLGKSKNAQPGKCEDLLSIKNSLFSP